MFRTLKHLSILVDFVRWLIPERGRSVRFYFSLLNILIGSRQSVFRHFRELKTSDRLSRYREFIRALATISSSGKTSVPATLLSRLLRTIYLTGGLVDGGNTERLGGPNQGYINHPQFSYGDSLQSILPPKSDS